MSKEDEYSTEALVERAALFRRGRLEDADRFLKDTGDRTCLAVKRMLEIRESVK